MQRFDEIDEEIRIATEKVRQEVTAEVTDKVTAEVTDKVRKTSKIQIFINMLVHGYPQSDVLDVFPRFVTHRL